MLGALVLLAILGEIGLRLFERPRPPHRFDEHVGRTLLPNLDTDVYIAEADRMVRLRTNRDGYRTPDRPHRKPPGVRRLVLLGDSFLQAAALDERDMLAARLEQHLGAGWEVLNFGHSGYNTAQSLLTWRHYAGPYGADVVVHAFTMRNDVRDNCEQTVRARKPFFDLDASGELTLSKPAARRSGTSRFLNRSRLYVWQKRFTRRIGRGMFIPAHGHWEHHVLNTAAEPEFEHAWKITEALFAKLRDEVEATGARFVVTHVPHAATYDADERAYLRDGLGAERAKTLDVELGERRYAEMMARVNVPRVSFLDALRESCEAGTKVNFEHGHWNEDGNRIAAAELYRGLVAMGVVR